jgi:hypothetical protein
MLAPSDPVPLTFGNLRFLPVLPGRMEFAAAIRHALLKEQPRVVAVELPVSLESAYRKAVRRLPEITVVLYEGADEDQFIYVPVEPADPFTEAVRTALEIDAELLFLEADLSVKPFIFTAGWPDAYAMRSLGYDEFVSRCRASSLRPFVDDESGRAIAHRLQGADPMANTAVVLSMTSVDPVLAALQEPQEEPPVGRAKRGIELINPHPDCLTEILIEYPYLQHRYEDYRMLLDDLDSIDRPRVQLEVLRYAEETYGKNTRETLSHWHRRLIGKYSRNLAITDGDLTPGVFDLCVAARSIVDDNYGWEVWESANRYPAQQTKSDLPTVQLSGEEVHINTRRVRLRRRLPRFKQQLRPSGLKKRPKEKTPGEWAQSLSGSSICSYPPEDLVVENYGRFLKQKAKSILSEERERVEPFTTSMMDGVDIRETIRNWHERKIYVRHQERTSGDVGSVVVVFEDERHEDGKYPYLTTWLGEHQNESDMAYYSTDPFQHLVGPGIGRAEYGGFLMTLPPRRMYDVWADPDYDSAETKAERLLLAGLDYSVERIVVYVAPKPPRSIFRSVAARLGHQILYVPLGQLSPAKLKKVRVVHVLDSYSRRSEAKDYIW